MRLLVLSSIIYLLHVLLLIVQTKCVLDVCVQLHKESLGMMIVNNRYFKMNEKKAGKLEQIHHQFH